MSLSIVFFSGGLNLIPLPLLSGCNHLKSVAEIGRDVVRFIAESKGLDNKSSDLVNHDPMTTHLKKLLHVAGGKGLIRARDLAEHGIP